MLYEADKNYAELRYLQNITEEHINVEKMKKMRVKTAAQIFSQSVAVAAGHLTARGDLPEECRQILPFVLMVDNLFDSLNASIFHVPNGRFYKGAVKRICFIVSCGMRLKSFYVILLIYVKLIRTIKQKL